MRRANAPDTSPVNAFSTLAMNISVTSTPTCQFPAGTSIPIDLGAVAQSAFVEGEIPRGYAPRSVNVSVTCSQIPSDYLVPLQYSFGGGAQQPESLHHHQPGRGRGGHGRAGYADPYSI